MILSNIPARLHCLVIRLKDFGRRLKRMDRNHAVGFSFSVVVGAWMEQSTQVSDLDSSGKHGRWLNVL